MRMRGRDKTGGNDNIVWSLLFDNFDNYPKTDGLSASGECNIGWMPSKLATVDTTDLDEVVPKGLCCP